MKHIVSPMLTRNSLSQDPFNQVGDHEENIRYCAVYEINKLEFRHYIRKEALGYIFPSM